MKEYLTPEQRALLEEQLAGDGNGLTDRQAWAAMQQGMRMAQADMDNGRMGGEETPASGRAIPDGAEELARNRMIQKDWMASAEEMYDLEQMMPEMAEYIMAHPRFSEDPEGLLRAYEAVRSKKYRREEELLNDPQFIERMANDERIKEAVIRAYLEEIRRGSSLPQTIGATQEAGKTPLSARKPITGMEQAKKRLEAMLAR